MSDRTKVVVWGGSAVSTPELVDVLAHEAAGAGPIELVLVGRNKTTLEAVGGLCRRLARDGEADLEVSTSTDWRATLEGADFVINQIRVGGLKGRVFDELFPRQFGIPGEETVGPGGFNYALRTIPVVLDYCQLLEEIAPDAVLVNLTNPSSLIQHAIRRYTGIQVVGTCDSPISLIEKVARVVGAPVEELSFDYAGMHHFGWILGVRWNGQDVTSRVLDRVDEISSIDPSILRAIGAVPVPYLEYYFHPDKILAKKEGRPARAEQLMELYGDMLDAYKTSSSAEKPDALVRRGAVWYRKILVPALLAMIEDSPRQLILSMDNDGAIPWLPADTIVELPAVIDASGVRPLAAGDPPADVKAMIQMNAAYERLAVEAIVEGSYEKALRALLVNWMVNDATQAQGILELIWPGRGEPAAGQVRMYEDHAGAGIAFPTIKYGVGVSREAWEGKAPFAVFTPQEPWELVLAMAEPKPKAVVFVHSMDWDEVRRLEREVPDVQRVVGLGGGSALDMAKYVAWKRGIACDLVPSICSTDSFATKSIAVREKGRVTYIGFIIPDTSYIDYELIGKAPKRLNRAGVGDLISIHTALWDWALARDERGERYDPDVAAQFRGVLESLEETALEINQVSREGIHFIMDSYAEVSRACRRFGSSQPQEGAEHAVAYNAEYITNRPFIHGELVALGTLVIASLQENEPGWVREVLEQTGVVFQPVDLGIRREQFVEILRTLNAFARAHGRRYTVLRAREVDQAFIDRMCDQLRF